MIVGPAMPMPRMLSTGGAFASAISSARIISSMKVSPRPPYSLGQVSPMNPAAWSLRCQSRSRSYASARGTSDDAARRAVHSRGMFPRSQARTSSRNDRCSGVGVSSMTPPGRRPGARLNDDSASFYGAPSAEVKAAAAAARFRLRRQGLLSIVVAMWRTPMSTVLTKSDFGRATDQIYGLVRYRERRPGELPRQIRGHSLLEIGWTIAPALVLLVIAIPTIQTIFRTQPAVEPEGAL